MKLFNTANDFGHIPDPPDDRGDCETCIHKKGTLSGEVYVEGCEVWDCEYEEQDGEE